MPDEVDSRGCPDDASSELRAELGALEAAVRGTRRRAAFASEASGALLSASLDLEQILERLTQLAVPSVADGCVVFVATPQGALSRRLAIHADPEKQALLQRFLESYTPAPGRVGGVYEVFRTSKSAFRASITDADLHEWTSDETAFEALRAIGPRSLVTVPLVARGRSLGVLCMGTTGDRVFEQEDIEMFSDLGEKAALAIDNAAAYASERRARLGTELLQALTTELARSLTADEIVRAVVAHGIAAGAAAGALWEAEADGAHARVVRVDGDASFTSARDERVALGGNSSLAQALRSGAPLFVDSKDEYEALFPREQDRVPPWSGSALAFLPLVVGDQRLAALVLSFDGHPGPDERASLLIATGHAGQALYRARLYEAERRARENVALLYRLLDDFNKAETLDGVLQPALDAVCAGLGVERSSILLFDEQDVMRFRAWRGLSDAYRLAAEGHTPWSRFTLDPQPIAIADVDLDPELEGFRPLFLREGIRSLAFVPLVHQREVLGKFMVYSATPRLFADSELRLARVIGAQIAHAVARKISESRALEARRAAERANRLKDEFLAVVSHELRTPLSVIVGWTSILRAPRGVDADTLGKGLEVIDRNAKAQARIIGDILDVSRIVTGKLVIEQQMTSLVAVVGEALDAARASARAKDIALEFQHEDEHYALIGDPDRLRQVVWNLLSNAMKFTPRAGRVEVRLRRELGSIVLEVEDNGLGIDPKFLPHVFERFRQADSSTTRREGGLGLGLAIVRHLVELHGGQVRVASEGVDRGSTFSVILPVRALQPPAAVRTELAQTTEDQTQLDEGCPADVLHGLRVMVVDDELDARELLREALGSYGAVVETAGSAGECLAALERFDPDVLVSDIGMPGEDGYHLIRELRRQGHACALPAIALTAFARPDDVAHALDAGFQRHVPKPVQPTALARTVRELCRS